MAKHLKPHDHIDINVSINTLEAAIFAVIQQAERSVGAGKEYYYDVAAFLQEGLDEHDKAKEQGDV